MSLRHGIIRTAVSGPVGTLAYGEASNPGQIGRLAEEASGLPVYGPTIEAVGRYLSEHHNPTVAVLGLGAMAVAVNRGPLFTTPQFVQNFLGKRQFKGPIATGNLAQEATYATMRTSAAADVELNKAEERLPSTTPHDIVPTTTTTTLSPGESIKTILTKENKPTRTITT